MSASDPIILSPDVVCDLPLFYRALAAYLVDNGRAVIEGSKKPEKAT